MAFLYSTKLRKITLTILLIWASVFFWFLSGQLVVNIIIVFASMMCLGAILSDQNTHYTTIYLSFLTAYVLYGYTSVNNLPTWLIMAGVLVIYLYLFANLEQKMEFITGQRLIYLFIFALLSLETFIFLSYFIISPINRSLILAMVVYTICGFCDSIISQKKPKLMLSYLLVFLIVFVTMLLTAAWGQI